MRGRIWTDDELAYLKANWQRASSRDLSLALDRTISAIQHKAAELGIDAGLRLGGAAGTGRIWTVDEERQLASMWCEGVSIKDIAKALRRRPKSVSSKRESMRLPRRKGQPVDMKLVRRLLDERKQYPEIIQAIVAAGGPALTKQQIGCRIRKAGWRATGGTRPRGSTWGSMARMGVLREANV